MQDFAGEIDSAKNEMTSMFRVKEDENLQLMRDNMKLLEHEYDKFSGMVKTHVEDTTVESTANIAETLQDTKDKLTTLSGNQTKNLLIIQPYNRLFLFYYG